jgi:cation:H+ antiporter
MFNTLFILGLSAIITPLLVRQKLVRREMLLVLGVSVVVLVLALGGAITRWQGALLLAGAVAYTVWAVRTERTEPPDVVAEYAEAVPGGREVPAGARHRVVEVAMVVVGLVGLVAGARWLVSGAVDLAVSLGLSELVVGVVIVAVGTSAPEVATSVVAAVRGERDIAVGNVVGSNLFNLLVVLGATAAVAAFVRAGRFPANEEVLVHLPGGDLFVSVSADLSRIRMRGPARRVFKGETAWLS